MSVRGRPTQRALYATIAEVVIQREIHVGPFRAGQRLPQQSIVKEARHSGSLQDQ